MTDAPSPYDPNLELARRRLKRRKIVAPFKAVLTVGLFLFALAPLVRPVRRALERQERTAAADTLRASIASDPDDSQRFLFETPSGVVEVLHQRSTGKTWARLGQRPYASLDEATP